VQTIALAVVAWLFLGSSSKSSSASFTPPPPPPPAPPPQGDQIGTAAANAGITVGANFLNRAINAAFAVQSNATSSGTGDTTVAFDSYPSSTIVESGDK
jgi:hypothetical protein